MQLVVEFTAEGNREGPRSRLGRRAEGQGRALELLVERNVLDADLRCVIVAQNRTVDREVERVQHDLVDAFVHLDRDPNGPRERRRLEIGLEDQVVSGRDDGARKSEAILHGTGAYRAVDAPCADAFRSIDPRNRNP